MKTWLRGALSALFLALSLATAQAAVVNNGNDMWWGPVPPPQPVYGQGWLDTSVSTDNPFQRIYDGSTWNLVGTCTNACQGTYTVAVSPSLSPGASSIASATTTSVGVAGTTPIQIVTGTTTITGLGTPAAGVTQRILVFTGALTLTNGTSLILPHDSTNMTTQIGDIAVMQVQGTGWRLMRYETAALFP